MLHGRQITARKSFLFFVSPDAGAAMSFLRRLLYGCWYEHGSLLRERRGKSYVLTCEVCGYEKPFPEQELRMRSRLNAIPKVSKVRKFPQKVKQG